MLATYQAWRRSGGKKALNLVHQVFQMEGFRQDLGLRRRVVIRVERDRREAGNEHHLDIGVEFGRPAGQFDPVHLRHDNIGDMPLSKEATS